MVMDVVMRVWARQLLLGAGEVLLLLHLGAQGPQSCIRLAQWSGRTRQQVHKSLKLLAARQLIHSASFEARGRRQEWALTSKGAALFERLSLRMETWEAELRPVVDLEELASKHEALVNFLLARPLENGWRRGLRVPREVLLNPYWDFPSLEAAQAWQAEVHRLATAPLPGEELAAQEARRASAPFSPRLTTEQRQWARAIEAWEALWR